MYRSNYIFAVLVSILMTMFLLSCKAAAETKPDNCVTCHAVINEEIVLACKDDVHARAGISCADCHGGNPAIDDEEAMNLAYGFIGAPDHLNQPQFCGKCHSDPNYMRTFSQSIPTDQVAKYWTSVHGDRLKKKDRKVAICSSCHNSHGIFPPNSTKSTVYPINVPGTCGKCHSDAEYMKEYGLPISQFEQYSDSTNVHGYALFVKRDMSAPACNDCHGNHGAAPPGIETVSQVCMQCHYLHGELFRSSPHKDGFDAYGVSECAFCHQASPNVDKAHLNIHTIVHPDYRLIGTDEAALCSQCHTEGDDGWKTASEIRQHRDSLETRFEFTKKLLDDVESRGFEISDARWMLDDDVHREMTKLRTIIHAFNYTAWDSSYNSADAALSKVLIEGESAEKEVAGRRIYYFAVSVIIGLLLVALIFKVREIEKE